MKLDVLVEHDSNIVSYSTEEMNEALSHLFCYIDAEITENAPQELLEQDITYNELYKQFDVNVQIPKSHIGLRTIIDDLGNALPISTWTIEVI